MQLEGKVALVTGGGRGIGRGIVERFVEEGARVAVLQRSGLDVDLAQHPQVAAIEVDLGDPEKISRGVDEAAEAFGRIDVVVNNAGMMFERSLSEIQVSEWQFMAAVNLQAPLFVVQAALPHLQKVGGGSIINIGSIEGSGANPNHAAYCATKAGIHGMTRALAVDLGADGIRCNAIAPGWIDSDLSEEYLNTNADPTAARETLVRLHPIGRTGRPDDVGNLAVFLASDQSTFLTGQIIALDGGRTALLPSPR